MSECRCSFDDLAAMAEHATYCPVYMQARIKELEQELLDMSESVAFGVSNTVKAQADRIAELEAAARWIPVEERVPDYTGKEVYVVVSWHGSQSEARDQITQNGTWKYAGKLVTHWRPAFPLPQPPTRGSDEQPLGV
jgi:hypothetical protein